MKAVYFDSFGANDVLKFGDVERPIPKQDEVLIKLTHTSVNPVDYKIRAGHLQGMMPHVFPIIPGWDASGTVVENSGAFKKGDRVFAYARTGTVKYGTYAEYTTLPVSSVAKAPASISAAEAAAVPLVALTAWQALFDFADLKSGETVFIPGGSGGVGSFAIQFAKIKGARVITTTSGRNMDYVKSLGADIVIDYTTQDVVQALRASVPEGIDVVLDCVGGDTQDQAWRVIKNEGRFVSIVDSPSAALAIEKNVKAGFWFVNPDAPRLNLISELIDAKKLQLPAISVRSINDAAAALAEVESRRVRGKIVLTLDF